MSNINNPPVSTGGSGGGGWTTYADQTAARAIDGTIYHNTTTKPVSVTVTINFIAAESVVVYCDATATPTQAVALTSTLVGGGGYLNVSFIVLAGYYYKITNTNGPTLTRWMEWY